METNEDGIGRVEITEKAYLFELNYLCRISAQHGTLERWLAESPVVSAVYAGSSQTESPVVYTHAFKTLLVVTEASLGLQVTSYVCVA